MLVLAANGVSQTVLANISPHAGGCGCSRLQRALLYLTDQLPSNWPRRVWLSLSDTLPCITPSPPARLQLSPACIIPHGALDGGPQCRRSILSVILNSFPFAQSFGE